MFLGTRHKYHRGNAGRGLHGKDGKKVQCLVITEAKTNRCLIFHIAINSVSIVVDLLIY